ncbi:MAG TPA: LCP family protein [Pseudonocardia sp.]|nr:LCP family protein [Pseudonocardia sp.]
MHTHPSSRSAGRPPGRSLAIAAGSALLPGLAHWVAGRRLAAVTIAALALTLLASFGVLALTTSRIELLRLAVRPGWLAAVIAAALAVALAWVVLVTGSYRVLGPVRTTGIAHAGVVLGLAVLSLLVAARPVAVARYAYLQRDLITNLFPDDPNGGLAAGEGGSGQSDPFAGRDRVTILLLASDAGPDRTGVRTDSIVAASIDTHTGDVVLLSLPRNLQEVPMPPGPLRDRWRAGFPDLLNSVYEYVTEQPGLLAGARDRGAEAIKRVVSYVLGIPVDYYAMVDLAGFDQFVNALGGVTITVTERLPIGGLTADGTRVRPSGYIEPGTQKLNGEKALWFARSRRDSTDYDRMLRQRCLIGAMVRQAEPLNVLKHFQELASATKRLAQTDIPRSVLPDLITLGDRMHSSGSIRSIAFVPRVISTGNPNYARIRTLAKAALVKPAPKPIPTPSASTPKPTPSPTATTPRSSPTPRAGATAVDVEASCGIG